MSNKILIRVKNQKNQRLLENFLGEKYEPISDGNNITSLDFDLAIFGDRSFPRVKEQVTEKKKREKPLFVPVLLLSDPKRKDEAAKYLGESVDEIIFRPVKKLELEARIDSLLKTRNLSLEKKQALRDSLTGCYNRRYLEEAIEKEIERSKRYGHSFSVMLIDINNFKKVNDLYSHVTGDEVLKTISSIIRENIRDADTLIRYGGDEFLILLPETGTGIETVSVRLKQAVRNWNETTDLINCQIGLAIGTFSWDTDSERDIEDILRQADRRMYRDKAGKVSG